MKTQPFFSATNFPASTTAPSVHSDQTSWSLERNITGLCATNKCPDVLTCSLAGTQWVSCVGTGHTYTGRPQETKARCSQPQTRNLAVTGPSTSQRQCGLLLKLFLGELCGMFKASPSKNTSPCIQELK